MTYNDCLWATVFDFDSLLIAAFGLVLATYIYRQGGFKSSLACVLVTAILSIGWAYSHYEFVCVELRGL